MKIAPDCSRCPRRGQYRKVTLAYIYDALGKLVRIAGTFTGHGAAR